VRPAGREGPSRRCFPPRRQGQYCTRPRHPGNRRGTIREPASVSRTPARPGIVCRANPPGARPYACSRGRRGAGVDARRNGGCGGIPRPLPVSGLQPPSPALGVGGGSIRRRKPPVPCAPIPASVPGVRSRPLRMAGRRKAIYRRGILWHPDRLGRRATGPVRPATLQGPTPQGGESAARLPTSSPHHPSATGNDGEDPGCGQADGDH
jgi:hypothetical protein